MQFLPTKPDGSIDAAIVERHLQQQRNALRETVASLRRLGATPMLLGALERAAHELDHAINEARQLND